MTSDRMSQLRQAVETGTRREAIAAADELVAEIRKLQRRRDAAKGPSRSEVMTYAAEIGLNGGEPENFFDYHTARGWKMGATASAPMRDWKAALRLWKRRCAPVNGRPESIGSRFGVGS